VGYGGTFILPPDIQDDVKAKARQEAEKLADDGAGRARTLGLDADTDVRETTGPVWRELLAAADDVDADAIVVGSRGFGEIKALMLGSTSQALAHHAQRPLVIVPTQHATP
jgi:nucleotide-binding universal stress UspA family protein